MNALTEKERLANVCKHRQAERPPLICPGGMMNAVTDEMARIAEIPFPDVHKNGRLMAEMAKQTHDLSGLENYGVPFCMTVEAEGMGATVDFGDSLYEPHVVHGAIDSVRNYKELKPLDVNSGRCKTVLDAIKILHSLDTDVPVIGNLTGPVSVAGTTLDCEILLREMRRDHDLVLEYMHFITESVAEFGKAMVEAGADCICIAEPTGTGELLGPKYFEEFSVQFLNIVLDTVKAPLSIVHICGNMNPVIDSIKNIHCDAFSFDAMTPIEKVRAAAPDKALMGNVSTFGIGKKDNTDIVERNTRAAIKHAVDIVAPACGIPTVTPLTNLHVMRDVVRSSNFVEIMNAYSMQEMSVSEKEAIRSDRDKKTN